MGLGPPPVVGLRLLYNAKSAAKVHLSVQPGDELTVSEDVAAQLVAADGHFVPYDADLAAVFPLNPEDDDPEEIVAVEVQSVPKPRKAPAKRAAASKK